MLTERGHGYQAVHSMQEPSFRFLFLLVILARCHLGRSVLVFQTAYLTGCTSMQTLWVAQSPAIQEVNVQRTFFIHSSRDLWDFLHSDEHEELSTVNRKCSTLLGSTATLTWPGLPLTCVVFWRHLSCHLFPRSLLVHSSIAAVTKKEKYTTAGEEKEKAAK